MRILFIDPGSTGALAVYESKQLVEYQKLPNLHLVKNTKALHQKLLSINVDMAVVEQQQGRSGSRGSRNGPKSIFGQGVNYGMILSLLRLCNLEPLLVPPSVWFAKVPSLDIPDQVLIKRPQKDTKLKTLALAIKLGVNVYGPNGGVQDGVADVVSLGWVYTQGLLDGKYYMEGLAC